LCALNRNSMSGGLNRPHNLQNCTVFLTVVRAHLSYIRFVGSLRLTYQHRYPSGRNKRPMGQPRVAIADDHNEMLEEIVATLRNTCEIVAIVSDGCAAVTAVQSTRPDIIVLDIDMPILNGLQAAAQIRKLSINTKIVFLTIYEDRSTLRAAQKVGCHGFVSKTKLATDLVRAIQEAMEGRSFVSLGVPPLDDRTHPQ
jgi:CheY-like chemotaxis protein